MLCCASSAQGNRECSVTASGDSNIRSLPPPPPLAEGHRGQGLTPLELAAGDERLVDLLTNYCCTHDDVMNSAFDG